MINTCISDSVIIEAVALYGTPVLCFEQVEIEKWFGRLKGTIPDKATLVYSLKAGPNPYLITYYNHMGIYFESASEGELLYLLGLGVKPSSIWVSGQGKTEEYLKKALASGITQYNIESVNELLMLKKLKESKEISCNIRVNPNFSNERTILKLGGVPSAFGIDEDQLLDILYHDEEHLVNGLFMYAGSQYFSEDDIIFNTEYLLKLAIDIYKKSGIKFKNIDFGGGFGVPENDFDGELDLDILQNKLQKLFDAYLSNSAFSDIQLLLFESGRYLSARTAVLITKVLDIKESRGKKFAITDMGINALGVKQKEYRLYNPIVKQLTMDFCNQEEYIIVGRTCTPIDQIHPNCKLSRLRIGDLLYIADCGAYSITFSPNNFCGLTKPAEVVHKEKAFLMTNRRESPEEAYGRTIVDSFIFQKF